MTSAASSRLATPEGLVLDDTQRLTAADLPSDALGAGSSHRWFVTAVTPAGAP